MSDPTDPAPTHPDGDDGAWFQAHVAPIVDEPTVPDAWPAILRRSEAADDGSAPARATATHRRAVRWVAAAAAVLLIAGAAVVLAGRDHRSSSVVTGTPDGSTGFFVPVGLPDGWEVVEAELLSRSSQVAACPCDRWIWTDGHGGHVTVVALAPYPDGVETGKDVDLGDGVTGTLAPEGTASGDLTWVRDGRRFQMMAAGLDDDGMVQAARDLVADPSAPPTGWTLLSHAAGGPRATTSVVVLHVRTDPEGSSLNVLMEAPWRQPRAYNVEYPTLELLQLPDGPALRTPASWGSEGYVDALYDQVEMVAEPGDLPYQGHANGTRDAGPEAYETMIRHLRPGTADQWRQFLDTVPKVSSELGRIGSLRELFEPGSTSDPGGTTEPTPTAGSTPSTEPTQTTDPTTTTPEPTPGEALGSVVSGPGIRTPRDQEYARYLELDDLDIRLELSSDVIRAGSPVTGTLVITNLTDKAMSWDECMRSRTQWGLVPASDPDAEVPQWMWIDCYGDDPNIGPRETVRIPLDWYRPTGFVAQRQTSDRIGVETLGTLPGGSYLAVVEIGGRSTDLRLSVPVTIPDPPCTTTDDDVRAYLRHSIQGAKDVAAERGDEIRLAAMDGKQLARTDDLRCGRINIDISYGEVSNAVRF